MRLKKCEETKNVRKEAFVDDNRHWYGLATKIADVTGMDVSLNDMGYMEATDGDRFFTKSEPKAHGL